MTEYLTETIVLDTEESGEYDRKVYCYTKELGKIAAKARSARKITSKLAGHLEPLIIGHMRIIEKNGYFQIVDALTLQKIHRSLRALTLMHVIKELTPDSQKDVWLWNAIIASLNTLAQNRLSYKPILESLGFGTSFAECAACAKNAIQFFSKKELVFLCKPCGKNVAANYAHELFPDLIEI